MLDVFMRRERHIYTHPLKSVKDEVSKSGRMVPGLREFGPQSEDDLINQRSLEILEKVLPVLNGLIYSKQGIYTHFEPKLFI